MVGAVVAVEAETREPVARRLAEAASRFEGSSCRRGRRSVRGSSFSRCSSGGGAGGSGAQAASVQLTVLVREDSFTPAARRPCPGTSRRGSILFLPADVSDIVVLFIAILDEDRTVEALLVIIVPVG